MSERKSTHLLVAGEEMAPLEFTVTPELNQQYLYAEEDFHPRYLEGDDSDGPMVHPGLLLNMSNRTRSPSFHLGSGWSAMHARDDVWFVNPARVGARLRVTWRVEEVLEKRGRTWHVVDTRMADQEGREILRRKIHSTFVHS